MAVENKYVSSNIQNDKLEAPAFLLGDKMVAVVVSFEVASGDDDGSVYRILKGINGSLIPIDIKIFNDSITGATDYDLGLYKVNLGAVISKDVFMDGADINAGNGITSPQNGLTNVDVANLTKKIFEHAGHDVTDSLAGYDIAITANTVGSASGTITLIALFLQG